MAHSNNIIKSILVDGITYEIHDEQAIHSIDELGLSAALVFKGTKATVSALPSTGNKVGDVWHVTENDFEYVWTEDGDWEELGKIYDAASSTHTHTITGTAAGQTASVTGKVAVTTVASTQKYLTAGAEAPTVTPSSDSVLGANTGFTSTVTPTTKKLSATISDVAVAGDGTATPITGFGTHTTAAAITALNTATVNSASATDVSIPNVTGNTSVTASKVTAKTGAVASKVSEGTAKTVVGSVTVEEGADAAEWSPKVDVNGVLSFSFTPKKLPSITTSEVSIQQVEIADVEATDIFTTTDVNATNTVLGTVLSASKVTTSEVTVATGSKSTANAITALGTPTTATVLTGVKVSAQPSATIEVGTTGDVDVLSSVAVATVADSTDRVSALTGVDVAAPKVNLVSNNATSAGAVGYTSAITTSSEDHDIKNGQAAIAASVVTGTTSIPVEA